MKRVTINDVAKHAGVSISTASKALRGTGNLNRETIQRIIKSSEKIGYTPNRAAQMLSSKDKRIGILISVKPYEVMEYIEKGLIETLENYGNFGIEYTYLNYDRYNDETDFVEKLQMLLPDINGLIFVPGYNIDAYKHHIAELNIPKISVQVNVEDVPNCYGVAINEVVVGKMAAQFLDITVKGAERNVAVISGDRNVYIHKKNIDGFISELDNCSLNFTDIYDSYDDMQKAYDITREILCSGKKISGIFTTSYVAPGICRCVKEFNMENDITVIGLDVFDTTIKYLKDGVLDAVIYQNQYLQGKQAVDNMVNAMNGIPMTGNEKIKPELVLRSNIECYI